MSLVLQKKVRPPRATLEQKIKILDYFHNSGRPQSDTVEEFKNTVAISTSTFNEWLKNELEYRERYEDSASQFEKHARRKVKYKYDKINRAMDMLVQQRLKSGDPITEPVLRDHWQIYAHQFGVDNPKRLCGFSHGWLSQFKKRHGLARQRGGGLKRTALETADAHSQRLSHNSQTSSNSPISNSDELEVVHSAEAPNTPQFESSQRDMGFQSFLSTKSFGQDETNLAQTQRPLRLRDSKAPLLSKLYSAQDIEKHIFNLTDDFFQRHSYEFPQSAKLYEEFKTSFRNEQLIGVRSASYATNVHHVKRHSSTHPSEVSTPRSAPFPSTYNHPSRQNQSPKEFNVASLAIPSGRAHTLQTLQQQENHVTSMGPDSNRSNDKRVRNDNMHIMSPSALATVDMVDSIKAQAKRPKVPGQELRISDESSREQVLQSRQRRVQGISGQPANIQIQEESKIPDGSYRTESKHSGGQATPRPDNLYMNQRPNQGRYITIDSWQKSAQSKFWEQNKLS